MKSIAIKELAYFVCGSGDLTIEFFSNHDITSGQMAHDYLQGLYNSKSKAEVYIKHEIEILNDKYLLHGYIDGVLNIDGKTIIEEIKSTTSDLDTISIDYHKEHLAQAKIYSYLYAIQNNMRIINTRLTYISIIDYETKSFDFEFNVDELEEFIFKILEEYISFNNMLIENNIIREKTIKEIEFPFETKRPGQMELMKANYNNLNEDTILYSIAPTGIGKTMATLFSALKTLKDKDKLFYLTAKGSGKNAPLNASKILAGLGLKCKVIDIVAKRKACNMHLPNCNPDECPYAKGYFDRLKEATLDILKNYDIYDSEVIEFVSNKHKICAFEFSLYISYFCDLVIADYNYVFDPHAHLERYFEDDTYNPKVLVDEAHNLVSRGKEMYSASITSNDLRELRKNTLGITPSMRKEINKTIEVIESFRDKITDGAFYLDKFLDTSLDKAFRALFLKIDEVMAENKENKKMKNKDLILDCYYKVLNMIRIGELFSDTHRLIISISNDDIEVYYYCLDASKFLLNTIRESIHGITLFSATLYPIKYYANLITGGEGKYIELKSPFNPNNLDIIINNSVSTKLKNRENSIDPILESIDILTEHEGNYIVFFPSYAYMNMVIDKIIDPDYEMIVQKK